MIFFRIVVVGKDSIYIAQKMNFSIEEKFPADLVSCTEKILNRALHCAVLMTLKTGTYW